MRRKLLGHRVAWQPFACKYLLAMGSDALHRPVHPIRFVTAASLFDGHDAAINIMRRLLQAQGAEVVHLGHNRSVDEIVAAVSQEDVQGVAVSSYQGGHLEFFPYLVDRLRAEGCGHVKVFGGGGGVIIPSEIEVLQSAGVTRIFSPQDGQRLGLARMVNTMIQECDVDPAAGSPPSVDEVLGGGQRALARTITVIEAGVLPAATQVELVAAARRRPVPVVGVTGTGGSGKSSLTDELVRRFRLDQEDKLRMAVLAVDPTRRKGGGALLGDRIRMNAIDAAPRSDGEQQVFFRSLATRGAATEVPERLVDAITACRAAGFDLVIVETPGIGQGDAAVVDVVDLSLYVMTPEFGAASQLEKIDMLDFADAVAINKFERRGAEDALRDVRRQMARNREAFSAPLDQLPVFGTIASRFNDDGVTALYQHLRDRLCDLGLTTAPGTLPTVATKVPSAAAGLVPPSRTRYLAQVADTVRAHHRRTGEQAEVARRLQQLRAVRDLLLDQLEPADAVERLLAEAEAELDDDARSLLDGWPAVVDALSGDEHVAIVDGREVRIPLTRESLAGTRVPRVALPRTTDHGDLLRWLRSENLPGRYPFTAGVFAFKAGGEEPARMFAGEGGPARTNRRFHLLAEGQPATRLSTAFDSVTLYGADPDERPDVYGKIGTSGVSIATLDDMKTLYEGFDLSALTTSVSMTINGPAPTILAMFLNTAIDQQVDRFEAEQGRPATAEEATAIRDRVLSRVRGTVQADILKEDQGQNTCIFSTEFSLGMMADVQQLFVRHGVRHFYAVSISGYHIAEAGANPITQLAFTLANGFTYVEAYLARGMAVDDFTRNLSFFFSNGMDPEYTVLGRVARRIWAIAMRDRYGADGRSQKLKYHVQTSGRSLHAQEMAFNDIRTTLQALCAIYDNANSLHTNAYDEAVTTPSADSVRRALAIQLVIGREWGLAANENPLQGSFVVEQLTDLVEEAVLVELERISARGGVLGAMETGYQRGRIQDESMLYEQRKHDGSLPIVGVNTFRNPAGDTSPATLELARSSDEEKQDQLARLRDFQARHANERPAALERLRQAALAGDNLFEVLLDVVRCCTLGEITEALFEVGGRYRRNV
ncbi:MAG: B12 binding domain / kinase domain / Methylmalonyl-CoA mutase [uncultured Acidimicrobiales bacterium]|uniref:Fused isobutyryl-CoA mutase n=1 Tax=uncultured Acidimicrobiales bacterium TaxID=310071 RepID=A0A6J4J4F6_9ACTN|nr:MAG: B12 binding domain / kinase domain / Methylmalonyl-CoA mutase [uncultured Acidimicrobiales bacterium]